MRLRIALLAAAIPCFSVQAAVLHVCPDGSGDYPSLTAAVQAASTGDEIELCDGVFGGLENVDVVVGPKDLVFRSLHGRDATTIESEIYDDQWGDHMPHRGFILSPGTTTRFEGITLRNFWVLEPADGAAIYAQGANVSLIDVRIQGRLSGNRRGAERGAGVFVDGGYLHAEDCQFIGNKVLRYGGAIYCSGGGAFIARTYFSGNATCNWGGAVYGPAFIEDCVFEHGGGGSCDGANPGGNQVTGARSILRSIFRDNHDIDCSCVAGAALIDGCLFEDNDQTMGACVRLGGGVVRNSTFRRNLTGSNWGAADLSGGATTLEHCVFQGSRGGTQSAAVRVGSGAVVRNCTFVAVGRGAALEIAAEAGSASVSNTIVAFGASTTAPVLCTSGSLSVTCTDIFGNSGGDWVGCVAPFAGTNGNLAADPGFCGVPIDDFSLGSASPCAPTHSGGCGLIGAIDVGCGTTAAQRATWGSIKAAYR